jgi:isoquinoline 1-oxidoreductase beta subunit
MSPLINLSRRAVLKGSGALILGFHLPFLPVPAAMAGSSPMAINAWLKMSSDTVAVIVARSEMGQGVFTTLPMLVAEELDVDWQTVRAEMAPLDPVYANPLLGSMKTGNGTSLASGFLPLRQAGAAARLMLMAAAARIWRVPLTELTATAGVVGHAPSDRQASYGALAGLAGRQPVPPDPPLRDPTTWTLIGRSPPRLDSPAKVIGQATFGVDVRLPNLLHAAIRHCPVLGGTLGKIDDSALKAKAKDKERSPTGYRPGVIAVVPLTNAVAVVAESWWQAQTALADIAVSWNEGANADLTSASLDSALTKALDTTDSHAIAIAVSHGDADHAIAGAARVVEAVYHQPFLAHAPLEPMSATASVTATGCTLWLPTQDQEQYAKLLPPLLGLKPSQITVNTTFLGGSFGRRLESDFGIQAALLSKAVGRPVRLVWSREEDIRHDFYRPASVSRVTVGLDAADRLIGWRHRIVAPSILARVDPGALKNGLDSAMIAGLDDQSYALPALLIDSVRRDTGVPVGFWRSGWHSNNAFSTESMIDEVAAAIGRDPGHLRRTLLTDVPRTLGVLDLVIARAHWDRPLAPVTGGRRGRGLALHQAFGSVVAEVAEVTVFDDGRLRVDRVVAVVDCGLVVHPDVVKSQIEGAILFGLSAALTGKITFDKGQVLQSNFHDAKALTLAEAPTIEVYLVESREAPSGVSDAGTPPIAPALTNAIFDATGQRLRRLPVADHDLRAQ